MATLEEHYQIIADAALRLVTQGCGRVVLIAEAHDAFVKVGVYYAQSGESEIRFVSPGYSEMKLVYEFWEEWGGITGNQEWVVMCLIIDGDAFNLDFLYRDDLATGNMEYEDQNRLLRHYFGHDNVNRMP